MSDKVEITYRGKTYYRLADLAHDYNIDPSLVSSRWHSGHRNPEDLLKRGKLYTIYPYAHQITYKGTTYKSAHAFALKYGLGYGKVLKLMKEGIRDPQELIDKGKKNKKPSIEILTEERKVAVSNRNKLLHDKGLLSVQQVSKLTNIPTHPINVLANSLIRGNKKKGYLGLQKSDLVKLKFKNQEDKKAVKNSYFIGEYGFKQSAVNHILERVNIIKNREMKQLPDPFSDYYYDFKNQTVWKYYSSGYGTVCLNLLGGGKYFKLLIGERQFKITPEVIEDILKNSEITYKDLLNKQYIIANSDLTDSRWRNRNLYKLLPPMHIRYDKTGTRFVGWTRQEYKKAYELNPQKLSPLND